MTVHVIAHAPCCDGFGAAFMAWQYFGGDIKYHPAKYGDPVPGGIEKDDEVYILDFSYDRQTLLNLSARCKKLVVLDHHKTAENQLGGLSFAAFDRNVCGAIMMWRYAMSGGELAAATQPSGIGDPPVLLQYIQDRDLWQFDLERSMEVSLALRSYPFDFEVWQDLMDRGVKALAVEGEAILRFQTQMVDRMCENARLVRLHGKLMPAATAACFCSEVCKRLIELYPKYGCAACYFDQADSLRHWELRSEGAVDVGEIAKAMGGGGHANAAGFTECLESAVSHIFYHVHSREAESDA